MPDGSSHAPNAPAPAAAAKADEPAKKHMMYSSWQSKPQSEWTFSQRVLARLDVLPNMPGQKAAPIKKIGDPIPVWTMSSQAMIAIPWTVPPIALHWAYMKFTGNTVHPVAAYLLYTAAYNLLSLFTTQKTNKMGLKYGFFDSAVKRDGVPDARTDYVLFEVLKVVLLRPLLGLILAYNREEVPSISILFPLKLAAFSMVLDFFFYTYHRAMHEVDFLWRFHSLHHRTKHPVSLLSAFADWEQEIVDAFGVPALTYLVMMNVPYLTVNYFEAFACMMFIVTAESGGHSGARVCEFGT